MRMEPGFGHRQHVALAWTYLQANDQSSAEQLMCSAIRYVASVHGTPEKYHETLTITWTRLVAFHVRSHNMSTFDEFIALNGDLLNRQLPEHYFSNEALQGAVARKGWIEPDLAPLPG